MQTTQGYRLSPQQKRLWELGVHGNPSSQLALRIEGDLEPELLRKRVEEIIARHEALRTGFYRQPGLKFPLQVINETASLSWKEINLDLSESNGSTAKIDRELARQRSSKLNGHQGLPVDVLLIRIAPSEHILSLGLPSGCVDTLSLVNIAREITEGFGVPKSAEDAELAQYLQFSEWQNELTEDVEGKEGLDYWNSRFAGSPQKLALPLTRSLPDPEQQIRTLTRELNRDALNRMEIATVGCGVSITAFLLACWQTLLWRLSGQAEIQVGYVSDGRKFKELEPAVGLFATTLPLELHLEAGSSFADVLRRVEHRLNEVLSWQEYFLIFNAQEETHSAWPAGFENVAWEFPYVNDAVRISLYTHSAATDQFVVKLLCSRDAEKLTLELAFDASVVRQEIAENLLEQFEVLAAHASESPEEQIDRLPVLSSRDQKLSAQLGHTSREWPEHQDVVDLFDSWAASTPDASAVAYEEAVLSYEELNKRASQLSWYLRSIGVTTESRVILLLPRSEAMVISLLAVLKAGAAYVPVEPGTPLARLQYVISETGAGYAVSSGPLAQQLEMIPIISVVLDQDQDLIAASNPLPAPKVSPENLAYILFTSGSTGKPKGVAVERRQLQNYVSGVAERLQLATRSRLAMVSSFAADLGNTMLFPALCSGGCLHVISGEKVTDSDAVGAMFETNQIEYLKIVPSHFSALLSASQQERQMIPRSALVFGGEALSWSLIDRIREIAPECRILNHYGPTETTVGVATHELTLAEDVRWGATVPLGLPLANSRLYILDEQQQPVPMAVPGELYIGGSGVCRGYWRRPELTAERFLPDPWNSVAGSRMYRTGDRVRLLPDGTVEYIDRFDRQIKIRGFRVELAEIEATILEIPEVSQAAVELRPSATGDDQMVAFISTDKAQKVTADHLRILRTHLRNVLPEHMVPAAFRILETLPLLPNGKVDRQVLRSMEVSDREETAFVSPREMGEEMLASLWREVLGVPALSVHDNFFQLGGDSLIATQLISRVRKLFQVELPVRIVFDAPTVSTMAAQIEKAISGEAQVQAPPIVPVDRNGDLVLSFGQERLWGIQQLDQSSAAYNSTAGMRLLGRLNEQALQQALSEIVRRHEVLRTTFTYTDGRPRQVIHPAQPADLMRVDLSSFSEESREKEIRRMVNQHSLLPFDLEHELPVRLKLIHVDDETNILLISMHHIVTDGWSQNIFAREFSILYDCFSHDRPSPLPELTIQYADFAAWQRQWLQGQVLENSLTYWRNQLANAPENLNFPTDYPRPERPAPSGSAIQWFHSSEQLERLKQLSRNEGTTLFMTLLTAYYIFLHQYTGQEDIVIGTDIANRNRVETENIIGFFVNNLALRVNLSGDPTVRELLDRVRTTALGAYAHQDLPFATLVKALRPRRSLIHTPIYQTLFVLQPAPALNEGLQELSIAPVDSDIHPAKFDLALLIAESDQGLLSNWTYRTDLFRSETITELGKDFNKLLAKISQHLDSPLSTLLKDERKEKHGKNLRLSNKAVHAN